MIGIGDKVVCIEAPWIDSPAPNKPQIDEIYTVRDSVDSKGTVFLRFKELINPVQAVPWFTGEEAFWIECFRKVTTIKTDISIFKEIDRKIFSKQPELVE